MAGSGKIRPLMELRNTTLQVLRGRQIRLGPVIFSNRAAWGNTSRLLTHSIFGLSNIGMPKSSLQRL
jgi:hypothetical protein